ncbi:hypothetical protein HYY71_05435, partial [Candidatus Woesearchaeota archaeon]|nr:hypothetical protein [Candidatus Woesearchaeota archaeon]
MRKKITLILTIAIILTLAHLVFAQDAKGAGKPSEPVQTVDTSPSCVSNAGAKCGQCGRGSVQCDGSCAGDYTTCDGRPAGFVGGYDTSESCGTCTIGILRKHCDGCNVDSTSCTGTYSGICTPGYGETQGCGTNNLGTQTRTCTSSCTWGQWSGCVMPPADKLPAPTPSLFPIRRYVPSFSATQPGQPIIIEREFGNHPTGTETFNIGQGAVVRKIVVSAIWRWEDGGSHHTSRAGYPRPSWEEPTGLPMCFSSILPDSYACRVGYNIPPAPSSWTAEFGCPDGTCPISINTGATGLFLTAHKDDGGSNGGDAPVPADCWPAYQQAGLPDYVGYDYCFGINSYSFNNGVVTLNWYGVTNRDIETKTKITIVADAPQRAALDCRRLIGRPPGDSCGCNNAGIILNENCECSIAESVPGVTPNGKCGICGRGITDCSGNCIGDYSRCSPQPETITTYADTSNQCGRCGTERLQCDGCNVVSTLCLGEIQGGCYPQTVQSELCNLGTRQGYRLRTCSSICSWSQWGDCILYPEQCIPGSTRSCTIGSATGTQTCRSDKTWEECIVSATTTTPPPGGNDGGTPPPPPQTLCTNINRDCRAYTREQFELIHQNYYSRGLTTYQSAI